MMHNQAPLPAHFVKIMGIALAAVLSTSAAASQITRDVLKDTYIDSSATQYCSASTLLIGDHPTQGYGVAFMVFNFSKSTLPANATIDSASAELYVTQKSGNPRIAVLVSGPWPVPCPYNGTGAFPYWYTPSLDENGSITTGHREAWDVTQWAREVQSGARVNDGLAFQDMVGGSGYAMCWSNEGTTKPRLVINYTVSCSPPAAPTNAKATPSSITEGDCAVLSATPGSGGNTVEWFTGSCGDALVPGGASPSVCPQTTTTYHARTKNTSNNCVSDGCSPVTVTVRPTYRLTVAANPPWGGWVVLNPVPRANGEYETGTVVTLTPVPQAGFLWSKWSGAVSGSARPKTATVTGDMTVTAHFTQDHHLGQPVSSGHSKDPVNTATGNFVHEETDLSIATRSRPLEFTRYYNSQDVTSGPLGVGWSHSYNIRLEHDTETDRVRAWWADGQMDEWTDAPEPSRRYEYVDLGPGRAIGVSQADEVLVTGGAGARLWQSGKSTDLSFLPGAPRAIAPNGTVAGVELTEYHPGRDYFYHRFFWHPVTGLDPLRQSDYELYLEINGVNSAKSVVGSKPVSCSWEWGCSQGFVQHYDGPAEYFGTGPASGCDPYHCQAFAAGINESGDVVGWEGSIAPPASHAFTSFAGNIGTFAGNQAYARCVNERRTVAGEAYLDGLYIMHAFRWTQSSGMIDLGTLGEMRSVAEAINNEDVIVGWTGSSIDSSHAFVHDGHSMIDLNTLVQLASHTVLTDATGINDRESIVGLALVNGEEHAFFLRRSNEDSESLPSSIPGRYDRLQRRPDGTWVVIRKNLDRYAFDASGRLTSITDKNGNALTMVYEDAAGALRLTRVRGPAGCGLEIVYDSAGTVSTVIDCAVPPRIVRFSYTGGRLTQVTDVFQRAIRYGYDANGYLATITDQRGVTNVTNVYDEQGRVTEQRDGKGNPTFFAYDAPAAGQTTMTDAAGKTTIHMHEAANKLLLSVRDRLGQTTSFGYDAKANRNTITDRNDNLRRFTYDDRGNVLTNTEPDRPGDPDDGGATTIVYGDARFPDFPTKKIDALGRQTTWEYDANGNVVRQVNAAGGERTWTYNSFGQKLTETDENGHTASWTYDADGRLVEASNAAGEVTRFGYDELWRRTRVTDARGAALGDPAHTTVIDYDSVDRVLSVTGPITNGSFQYDAVGNLTRRTNGRGYATVYTYDNNSDLSRVERPAPGGGTQVIQHTYDHLNRRTATTDANGHVTQFEYDDDDRLVGIVDAEDHRTAMTCDAHGNVVSVTDASSVATGFEYDGLHRKVRQYNALGNNWRWTYDRLGRITKYVDANGNTTTYAYDELGRLTGVTDPAGHATAYLWDAVGNLTRVTDAVGKVVARKTYDVADRLIRQEDGLARAYEYTYDAAGNQRTVKDAKSKTTTLDYDNQNRLSAIHYPDGTQVTYTYDADNNLLTDVDPAGTTTLAYDELDRLTASTDAYGKVVRYGYDLAGNRTSLSYPAGGTVGARTVAYAYDRSDRLTRISDWIGGVTDYATDGAGRVTQVTYPNGMKEHRTYDPAGRLAELAYTKADGSALLGYTYTRDGQGNPVSTSEAGTLAPDLAPMVSDISYSYDTDNELTSTNAPATYAYDGNGNQTSRTAGGKTTTFAYDAEDRLVTQTTSGTTVRHTYDGLGNRIARVQGSTTTRYVLDRGRGMSHVLTETNASGQMVADYIHGPGIIGRIGADGTRRYYLTDAVGTVVALVNESQAITDRYAHEPFGVPAGREGTSANPFTYVGSLGVMAEADGLYFMRARFYDPENGRFLGKDPEAGILSEPDRLHPYVYALNRPTVLVDPEGTTVFYIGIGGGTTWAGGVGGYASGELRLGISGWGWDEIGFYITGSGGVATGARGGGSAQASVGLSPAPTVRDVEGVGGVMTIGGVAGGGGSLSYTSSGDGMGIALSGLLGPEAGADLKLGPTYTTKPITFGDIGRDFVRFVVATVVATKTSWNWLTDTSQQSSEVPQLDNANTPVLLERDVCVLSERAKQ